MLYIAVRAVNLEEKALVEAGMMREGLRRRVEDLQTQFLSFNVSKPLICQILIMRRWDIKQREGDEKNHKLAADWGGSGRIRHI